MSYVDALNDNIKTGQLNGMTVYYPLCHVCGEPMLTYSYRPNLTFTCKGCKLDKYLSDKENRVISTHELKERKFQNAVSRLSVILRRLKKYTTNCLQMVGLIVQKRLWLLLSLLKTILKLDIRLN